MKFLHEILKMQDPNKKSQFSAIDFTIPKPYNYFTFSDFLCTHGRRECDANQGAQSVATYGAQ